MKVLILAGGLGTRLRQITGDQPKPMVDVNGKPFLQWQLEFLKGKGIDEVIISVGYKAERVISHFGDGSKYGMKIYYSIERKPLGTGGAIKNAKWLLKGESDFVVMNGDTYMLLNPKDLMNYHANRSALATMVVIWAEIRQKAGLVTVDGNLTVSGIKEVQEGKGFINAGMNAFSSEIFDFMPESETFSLEYDLLPSLIKTGRVHAFQYSGYFRDIGTPEGYSRFLSEVSSIAG